MKVNTLNELLEAWELGAVIAYQYRNLPEKFIGPYRAERVEVVKALFYRQGVKFKVRK